jgi:CubicO group peptidase (beta-lactamase class C family)
MNPSTAVRHRLRMVFTGALIVLLAIGASAARAQTPNLPAFERQVEADRNALKIPGLSIIVIQDGEVLWARGFGYADVEQRIPATPDTLYHIASLTKTFTAILVLQRVEQGKLDLDEPVSRSRSSTCSATRRKARPARSSTTTPTASST